MITLDNLTLPSGLQWSDEYNLQSIQQTAKRTLEGSLDILSAPLSKGVAITLESLQDGGWATRTLLDNIKQLALQIDSVYVLTIRGASYNVSFRYDGGSPIEATPVFPPEDSPGANDYYIIKLRLMTV